MPDTNSISSASNVPLRILYAEDLRELRELIRKVFGLLGHRVECFENGQLAWDRVRGAAGDHDLIITDHHMPVMNGLEFVRLLRTTHFNGRILVFSSDLNPVTASLYRQFHVDRILNKPVPPHELRQVVSELFSSNVIPPLPDAPKSGGRSA